MDKGDSFSSTNNDEEYEDVAYITPELQFSAILDISFFSTARNNLFIFSAKINSSPGIPFILGIIFSIIPIIQIILSSLLVNSIDLWPTNQILSTIFRGLEAFIDGPSVLHQEQRILMSFILSLIYFFFLLYVFVRSFSYVKEKIVSKIEIFVIILFSKYIFIIFFPHLLAGLPIAIFKLIQNGISAIETITVLLVAVISLTYMLFYCYLIQPRVLLERCPFHEWLPLLPIREVSAPICITIGTCIGFLKTYEKKSLILFPIINALIFLMSGIYVVYYSNYVHQKYTLFLSSSFFSSSFISIFQVLNILIGVIKPTLIIILMILLFVIFFLITLVIQRKRIFSMDNFCNECLDFPERCHNLIDQRFPTPTSFLRQIIPIIDQWHPFLIEWKLFDYALLKWPRNFDILILYARILSFFPRNNKTIVWICSLIIKSESQMSAVYVLQFKQIMQERQKNSSLQLIKRIEDIKIRIYVLITLNRRFWENILQKNLTNFWADVDKIAEKINDLDRTIIQLTDDFPNNIDVFNLYYQFLKKIKYSPNEAQEIDNKITLINKQGYQKADTAMSLAQKIFKNIQPYIQEYQEYHTNINYNNLEKSSPLTFNSNSASCSNSNLFTFSMLDRLDLNMNSNFMENKSEEQSESENMKQFQLALQELTEHTKLGRVWIVLLVCTIMTAIVIGTFSIFSLNYIHDFILRQEKVLDFMSTFGLLRYKIVFVNLFMSMQSLFLSEKILNNQNTMYTIAPNLYTKCHNLPRWRFSTNVIESVISDADNQLTIMMKSLDRLENWNNYSIAIKNAIKNTILYEDLSLNFQSTLNYLFKMSKDMVRYKTNDVLYFNNLSTKLNPLFDIVHPFLESLSNLTLSYALNDNDESMDKMTSLLVVVVIIALVLVSIPLIFSVFALQTESNAISDSFLFFPNNEIRATINKFGLSSSKKEDDSTYIAKVTHRPSGVAGYFKLFVTFLTTFFPLMICCFVMHFIAFEFIEECKTTSLQIWTLYEPFTDLVMALEYSVLVSFSDVLDYGSIYRDNYAKSISQLVTTAEGIFADGMYGTVGSINTYYNEEIDINYFDSCFPINKIPQTKSLFESLVTDEFPLSIDLVCASLKCLSTRLLNGKMDVDDPELLSLYFYFTDFMEEYRVSIYFDSVEKNARSTVSRYRSIQNLIVGVVVVCQILAFVFIILILTSKHNQIRNSLLFFHELSPAAVTQNQNAVLLLSTGRIHDEKSKSSFSNADQILSQAPLGVVLIDRQLIVTDFNYAFLRIIRCENKDISGKPITEIIHRTFGFEFDDIDDENEVVDKFDKSEVTTNFFTMNENEIIKRKNKKSSWPNFIQKVSNSINGKYRTTFSERVTVNIGEKRNIQAFLIFNVICLTSDRPAVEGEHDLIEKVAIVVSDITDDYKKKQIIEKKQNKLTEMIANVIPKRLVNVLLNCEDSISFSSQCLTIGEIDFSYQMSFDYKSPKIFSFVSNLLNECDNIISSFNLLCKIRTDGQKYIFAGGLFNQMCKPEKHSEQAIEFALRVINNIIAKYDTQISIKVGIQTGGPVIASVISINRPNLQIIGPIINIASELAESCTPNQVHISLSVYELVFTSGFNVVEKENILTSDGNSLSTYSVIP